MPRVDREWPIVTLVRKKGGERLRMLANLEPTEEALGIWEYEDYVPKRYADELRDAAQPLLELLQGPEQRREQQRIEADEVLKRAER